MKRRRLKRSVRNTIAVITTVFAGLSVLQIVPVKAEENNYSASVKEDNGTLNVSATAQAGVLPEDAKLVVTPVKNDGNDSLYTDTLNKLNTEAEKDKKVVDGFIAYDIQFEKDDQKVEPENGSVNIDLNWDNPVNPTGGGDTRDKISVIHLKDDSTVENLSKETDTTKNHATIDTDENNAEAVKNISIQSDSFSVYAVMWMKDSESSEVKTKKQVVSANQAPPQASVLPRAQEPVKYSNQLVTVFDGIGHYQLNYAASSNAWTEDGQSYAKGYVSINSGFSHLDEVKSYEKATYGNNNGNSSAAYLDGQYNSGGTIYKAYFGTELVGTDSRQSKYPVTLVYGGNNEQPSPVEGKNLDVYGDNFSSNTAFSNNAFEWTDITDFVKANGYGWYYACNIPGTPVSDCSLDWKIVVVEENPKLPTRMVEMKFGSLGKKEDSGYEVATLQKQGYRTKLNGTVTGQVIYNISNDDLWNCGSVQIAPNIENPNVTDPNNPEFVDVRSGNKLRWPITDGSTGPLGMLKSRNTNPIRLKVNYSGFQNRDGVWNVTRGTGVTYPLTGSDMELLDIDGTTRTHNITFQNGAEQIGLRFNPSPAWLAVNIFGMAVDVDEVQYDLHQDSQKIDGGPEVRVTGTAKNMSTVEQNTGLKNGNLKVTLDENLASDTNEIKSISASLNGTNINSPNMWTVGKDDQGRVTVTFTVGNDANGITSPGDTFSYEINVTGSKRSHDLHAVTNDSSLNGMQTLGDTDTGPLQEMKANSVVKYTLYIDPNGGTWNGNQNVSAVNQSMDVNQTYSVSSSPSRTGYTFAGWEIGSATNRKGNDSTISNKVVTMGVADTVVKAKWNPNLNVVKVDSQNTETHLTGSEFQITKDGQALLINNITDTQGNFSIPETGIMFNNLTDGTYTLKEIKAPSGYNRLDTDVTFKVENGNVSLQSSGSNAELTNGSNGWILKVKNTKGVRLPDTGGIGKNVFMQTGIALIVLSGFMIFFRKSKKD